MQLIYNHIAGGNYGLAIILFTIFVRLLLLPLNIKQQRSMTSTQKMQPELQAIQKQYKGEKEKINEETMKLYKKYNANPMSSCLPILIQFPIIIALFNVIRKPLTYIAGLSSDNINSLWIQMGNAPAKAINQIDQILLNSQLGDNHISHITVKFLGIFDLGATPQWNPSTIATLDGGWGKYLPLIFIPIISAIITYYQSKISMPKTKNLDAKPDDTKAITNSMTAIMPFVTLFFTFTVPAGLGLYWIIGGILGIVQTVVINKMFAVKKEGSAL